MAALPPGFAGGPNVAAKPQGPSLLPDYGENAYESAAKELEGSSLPQYSQPTYTPPNKTGEIVAGAISALFPGSPAATLASSYMQGSNQAAQSNYDRAQQAEAAKYQAAQDARAAKVQNVQLAGQTMENQLRLKQQADTEADRAAQAAAALEEKKARDAEIAQEKRIADQFTQEKIREQAKRDAETHSYHVAQIQENNAKYALAVQKFGLSEEQFNRQTRKDNMQTALALTRNQMSYDTAQQRMGLQAKLAAFNQFRIDRRNANDQATKIATAQVGKARALAQSQIAAELKSQDDDDVKQAKIKSITDAENAAYSTAFTPVLAKNGELGATFDGIDQVTADSISSGAAHDAGVETGTASPTVGYTPAPESAQSLYGENLAALGPDGQPSLGAEGGKPIPTPTLNALSSLMQQVGATPQEAAILARVGANESSGDPNAANPAGTGVGLWQINPKAHGEGSWTDPVANAKYALGLYRAQGLRPWLDSRDKGAYGGWGKSLASVPAGPSAQPWLTDPNFRYGTTAAPTPPTDPHDVGGVDVGPGMPARTAPTLGGGAPVNPTSNALTQGPSPQQVQQAVGITVQQIRSGVPESVLGAHLVQVGFQPPQVQHILKAARDQFNTIEKQQSGKPSAPQPASPPTGTDVRAARMAQANTGQPGLDISKLITVGGPPSTRNYRQAPPTQPPPNIAQQLVRYINAPPPAGTYAPPSQAESNQTPPKSQLKSLVDRLIAMPAAQRGEYFKRLSPQIQSAVVAALNGR
jgi:hypothetical protein